MADALNDEWWVSEDADSNAPEVCEDLKEAALSADNDTDNKETGSKKEDKPKVGGKRKSTVIDDDITEPAVKSDKSRKRRKKKRITETKLRQRGASANDFRQTIDDFFKEKLSVVEKEALLLADEHFGPANVDLSHSVPSFLKQALPKWQRISAAHSQKMAPLIIILTSNANRALDLNRQASSFKGEKCKTAKLFARHLKPEAQAKLLESNTVHFAIGTPARVSTLLAQDSLVLDHTRLVMLDWNWRDVKLKRMVDVVDVRRSLMNLLKDHVVPACKSHLVKIGLY